MAKKTKTVPEVLTAYREKQGFENDSALALELGVSRQSMSQWLNGVHEPSRMLLRNLYAWNIGTWKAELAVDLLRATGADDEGGKLEAHWLGVEKAVVNE